MAGLRAYRDSEAGLIRAFAGDSRLLEPETGGRAGLFGSRLSRIFGLRIAGLALAPMHPDANGGRSRAAIARFRGEARAFCPFG